MTKLASIFIAAGVLMASVLLVSAFYVMSVYNRQASIQNLYDAKLKSNNADFDNTWKVISQNYQVAEKNKAALQEIFTSHAAARNAGSENDNLIMKWVQESIPNADLSIYKTLANTITGARNDWTMRQRELVEIARQYNEPLMRIPSKWILGMLGFNKIDARIVTSSRTDRAFETGKDDDVELK